MVSNGCEGFMRLRAAMLTSCGKVFITGNSRPLVRQGERSAVSDHDSIDRRRFRVYPSPTTMSESHPFDSGMLAEMLSGTETSISPQMVEENSSNGFEDLTSSNSKSDDLIAEIKTIRENIAKENALPPMKVNPIPRDVILYIFHQERNEGEGLRTTYVGLKQSYSRQPLSDLKQINISQMWVRKRHEVRKFPYARREWMVNITGRDAFCCAGS
ncbi:hypothetical protein BD410DRAFT_638707 [Rickenella mellea]|uniref:Uncharacterized protein n=1 Tax=Rickenella mellea TaxID=50990 RepID=A0A4Y7QCK2_9AGAM|nr:hypothetical protein BD410DRAFT_638707 [Rickenella mellea]